MCDSVTEKAKDITQRIREFLLNTDLSIVYAQGVLDNLDAEMKLLEGKKDRYHQKKFIEAKIQKEKEVQYIEDLNSNKQKVLDNLSRVIDKYNHAYKKVFVSYFIEDKSVTETAEISGYSIENVKKIIQKLRVQLVATYPLDTP